MCKKWYQSRTVWLNVLTIVASGGSLVGNFSGLLSPVLYAVVMTVIGLANVGLRMVTDQGIEK